MAVIALFSSYAAWSACNVINRHMRANRFSAMVSLPVLLQSLSAQQAACNTAVKLVSFQAVVQS